MCLQIYTESQRLRDLHCDAAKKVQLSSLSTLCKELWYPQVSPSALLVQKPLYGLAAADTCRSMDFCWKAFLCIALCMCTWDLIWSATSEPCQEFIFHMQYPILTSRGWCWSLAMVVSTLWTIFISLIWKLYLTWVGVVLVRFLWELPLLIPEHDLVSFQILLFSFSRKRWSWERQNYCILKKTTTITNS